MVQILVQVSVLAGVEKIFFFSRTRYKDYKFPGDLQCLSLCFILQIFGHMASVKISCDWWQLSSEER